MMNVELTNRTSSEVGEVISGHAIISGIVLPASIDPISRAFTINGKECEEPLVYYDEFRNDTVEYIFCFPLIGNWIDKERYGRVVGLLLARTWNADCEYSRVGVFHAGKDCDALADALASEQWQTIRIV
jgi:hypothetical protein